MRRGGGEREVRRRLRACWPDEEGMELLSLGSAMDDDEFVRRRAWWGWSWCSWREMEAGGE